MKYFLILFFPIFIFEPLIYTRLEYVEFIEAPVTAYSEIDSCHYKGCPMASGTRAYIGAVACPREMKLGTIIEIEGKTYECEDRTHKKYDGRFDIFMGYGKKAYKAALEHGIQILTIKIVYAAQ